MAKVVDTCIPNEETPATIAKMMVGELAEQEAGYVKREGTNVIFSVTNLSPPSKHPFGTALKDINLTLKAGEILGIAGVAGNGQDELMAIISGEDARNVKQAISLNHLTLVICMPAKGENWAWLTSLKNV